MRRPIATVTPAEAFKELAASLRYNPRRLALLRRIYVGRFSHQEAKWPGQQKITFNVPSPPSNQSSPRR